MTGEIDEPGSGGKGPARKKKEEKRKRRPVQPEWRVPAWVVIPLAVLAGYFVSGIPGGIFGLLVGLVLWWSRR